MAFSMLLYISLKNANRFIWYFLAVLRRLIYLCIVVFGWWFKLSKRRYNNYNNDFYHSKEWKKLRVRALERDNYLCRLCLKRGKITPAKTVHHITPLRVDNAQKLELNNLITVCESCHNELHKEKSYTNEKKQKFIQNKRRADVVEFGANIETW